MAVPFRKAPRARETTASTGTGATINLDLGARLRHQTLVDGLLTFYGDTTPGDQAQAPYTLLSGDGLGWENGIGTVTLGTPSTWTRDIVIESSNANARINLVGVSEIFIYTPAMEGFFQSLTVRNTGGSAVALDNFVGGASGSYASFESRGAAGTEDAPTYPTDGMLIGGYTAWGWNENINGWSIAGQILTEAAENWTASTRASRMKFGVNAAGASVDSWDGTYNTDFTLSGSNLIATTVTGSIVDTIIGTALNSSGKKYFELHITTSASDVYFGLAEPAHANDRRVGDLSPAVAGTTKSVGFNVFSNISRNFMVGGASTASGMDPAPGLVNKWLGFAVDLDNGYILVRDCSAPTVWYGNNSSAGDPASISTHGFHFTPFGASLAIAFTSNENASGETTTMNAGGSAFAATPPSGYAPWATGSAFSSLVLWEDAGISAGGLTSQGLGTLNFHAYYVDDVLIADTGGVAVPTMVGDTGSGGTKGLVPAPGAGDAAAGKVLGAGGTWVVPGGLSSSLASTHIFVGNGSNIATDVAVTGDVTISNTGVTAIGSHKVTAAMQTQMASHTFRGNNTGSTADVIDLTATQLTAELNAVVGDSGSGGTKGLVPAPGAGDAAAGKFLGAGGTFSVPAGTGPTTLDGLSDATITSAAENDILVNVSGQWINARAHYDVGFSAPQTTAYTASQVVGHHDFSCAVTIPANFGSYLGRTSRAGGSAVTTGSTVFSVEKAAAATPNTFSQVGTITFATGTVTPTFASSGGTSISFAANDRLRIVAPGTPDATFAGFYATIVGSET
jgi:hypothetical protein